MPAYVIGDIEVTDPEGYESYKALASPAIEAYGGRYLVRGGEVDVLEGDWTPRRLVTLEFESVARARECLESPEYREARGLRRRSARANMVVVDGARPTIDPVP